MAAVKQISVRQLDNTYLTNPIGADAENIDIDSTHTLADKASDWDSKVDSVSGKGLSTNDYTTEEKTKLGNIESGAEVNVIETITVNGTAQTVTNKTVNIPVPSTENLAPTNHASTTTIYGAGTSENYGHVKVIDAVSGARPTDLSAAASAQSVYDALQEVYDALDDKMDKDHEVELTQSEYDALPESEKTNGKTYFVVDD